MLQPPNRQAGSGLEDIFPRIPEGLIEALERRYPNKPHTPETSLRQADWNASKQELFEFLRARYELQNRR